MRMKVCGRRRSTLRKWARGSDRKKWTLLYRVAAGDSEEGDRAARVDDFGLSGRGGRAGRISAAPSGLWAGREDLPAMQHGNPEDCGCGTEQLFLPELPAGDREACKIGRRVKRRLRRGASKVATRVQGAHPMIWPLGCCLGGSGCLGSEHGRSAYATYLISGEWDEEEPQGRSSDRVVGVRVVIASFGRPGGGEVSQCGRDAQFSRNSRAQRSDGRTSNICPTRSGRG